MKSEILEELKENDNFTDCVREGYEETYKTSYGEAEVSCVVENGGYEGGGESVERVSKIKVGDLEFFVRETGYYYSYHGTDWHGDFSIVEPKQKTITVYE